MTGRKLTDHTAEQLEAALAVIENKYPAPTVSSPSQLAGEADRYVLAFNAGKFSVVEDINAAIQSVKNKPLRKPQEQPRA